MDGAQQRHPACRRICRGILIDKTGGQLFLFEGMEHNKALKPKVHPPEHGCTWMHLDAERRKA
jgi:hypothetical protein